MDINQFAAKKLKELRIKKRITQEELAESLGITQQQVERYENGKRNFKLKLIFELAAYFKISINDFFPPTEINKNDYNIILKKILKEKGFLNENEEMTNEEIDKLIDFLKINKDFLINKEEKNKS